MVSTGTAFFFNLTAAGLNAAIMLLTWRLTRPMPGPSLWFVGALLHIGGMLLLLAALTWDIPPLAGFANLFLVGSVVWILAGVDRYNGRRPRWPRLIGAVVLLGAVMLWATAIHDNAQFRIGFTSLLDGTVVALVALRLRGGRRGDGRLARNFAQASWALFSALMLARGVVFMVGVVQGLDPDVERLAYMFPFIIGPMLLGAGMTSLVLMTMQRLIGERKAAQRRAEVLADQYRRLATYDALTGALSRAPFLDLAADLQQGCREEGRPFSLLLLDLDHFKEINDTHGHNAGDAVLRVTVARILGGLRDGDLVGRLGGEEFAIALPGAALADAFVAGERLRLAVSGEPVPAEGVMIPISFSAGLVEAQCEDDLAGMMLAADRLLYRAKAAGRDRIVTQGMVVEPEPVTQTGAGPGDRRRAR